MARRRRGCKRHANKRKVTATENVSVQGNMKKQKETPEVKEVKTETTGTVQPAEPAAIPAEPAAIPATPFVHPAIQRDYSKYAHLITIDQDEIDASCTFCFQEYDGVERKEIKCPSCQYTVCKACFIDRYKKGVSDPMCFNTDCQVVWHVKFVREMFGDRFYDEDVKQRRYEVLKGQREVQHKETIKLISYEQEASENWARTVEGLKKEELSALDDHWEPRFKDTTDLFIDENIVRATQLTIQDLREKAEKDIEKLPKKFSRGGKTRECKIAEIKEKMEVEVKRLEHALDKRLKTGIVKRTAMMRQKAIENIMALKDMRDGFDAIARGYSGNDDDKPVPYRQYRCPVENCMGFTNENMECRKCGMFICEDCHGKVAQRVVLPPKIIARLYDEQQRKAGLAATSSMSAPKDGGETPVKKDDGANNNEEKDGEAEESVELPPYVTEEYLEELKERRKNLYGLEFDVIVTGEDGKGVLYKDLTEVTHVKELYKTTHKCNPDDVETVKYLMSNTKNCPKCGTPTEKSKGCNMMFCITPTCWTWYDWATLKEYPKGTARHNDEYLALIDRMKAQGLDHTVLHEKREDDDTPQDTTDYYRETCIRNLTLSEMMEQMTLSTDDRKIGVYDKKQQCREVCRKLEELRDMMLSDSESATRGPFEKYRMKPDYMQQRILLKNDYELLKGLITPEVWNERLLEYLNEVEVNTPLNNVFKTFHVLVSSEVQNMFADEDYMKDVTKWNELYEKLLAHQKNMNDYLLEVHKTYKTPTFYFKKFSLKSNDAITA